MSIRLSSEVHTETSPTHQGKENSFLSGRGCSGRDQGRVLRAKLVGPVLDPLDEEG